MGIREKAKSKIQKKVLGAYKEKAERAAKQIIADQLKEQEQELEEVKEDLSKLCCTKCKKQFSKAMVEQIVKILETEADVDEEYEKMKGSTLDVLED